MSPERQSVRTSEFHSFIESDSDSDRDLGSTTTSKGDGEGTEQAKEAHRVRSNGLSQLGEDESVGEVAVPRESSGGTIGSGSISSVPSLANRSATKFYQPGAWGHQLPQAWLDALDQPPEGRPDATEPPSQQAPREDSAAPPRRSCLAVRPMDSTGSSRSSRSSKMKMPVVFEAPPQLKVESGTLCFATVPAEAPIGTSLVVFASTSSWERIGELTEGQQVVAAGPPEEIDGYTMVPIRPEGAVDISVLQLEPVKRPLRSPTRRSMRRSTVAEAAFHLHSRSSPVCDPIEDLPGERVLVTALGTGGSAHGGAVADAFVSSSRTPLPVQVDVTNYRLRLAAPETSGANLYVMVCCGQGLVATDKSHIPDPFAVISLSGQRHRSAIHPRRTSVKSKTGDPVWNEAFSFEGVQESAILRVQLYDASRGKGEDYMGEVLAKKVARLPTTGRSPQRQWSVTLSVRFGELDVSQGDTPPLGTIRLLLKCSWPTPGSSRGHCSIPLAAIEKVSFESKTQRLSVATKATEQFVLQFDTAKDAQGVHARLAAEPERVQNLLCLSSAALPRLDPRWQFNLQAELQRWTASEATCSRRASPEGYAQRWRVDSEVNGRYQLCKTYPKEIVLPVSLRLNTLKASANFRTKNRFPLISWVHPCNGAVLVRCSQPMVGSAIGTSGAAKKDHDCLMAYASGDSREVTICDARPYKSAQANRMGGGGTESSLGYESCNMLFLDIENIHVMRESLHGLRAAVCQQDDYSMYAGALTKWLTHVRLLICGANTAAEMVESGMSVVVHCSDGWDRTSQLASMASVLLDGHYRTIKGLCDLVQKDWLLPGHKFRERNGLASRKEQVQHATEQSPIFLQFLDALSQVWNSYPRHFEYTPHLLSFLLYHSLSGRYCNFLCNCQKEREDAGIPINGSCLWTEIMESQSDWVNHLYDQDLSREPIVPCNIPLQQHGYSRDLYVGFSTWWDDQSRLVPTESSTSNSFLTSSTSMVEPRRSIHMANVISDGSSSGRYIFCSPREELGYSTTLACELLLRNFLGISKFPPQPIVRVVSHIPHQHWVLFTIEMCSPEGDDMHYVTRSYRAFCELRDALLDQVNLEVRVDFPPKLLFRRCRGRELEDRLVGLDIWLRSVVAAAWVLPEEETAGVEAERCWDQWWSRVCFLRSTARPRPTWMDSTCGSLELTERRHY